MALTKGNAAPIPGAEQKVASPLTDTTQPASAATAAGIPDDPAPANIAPHAPAGVPQQATGTEVVGAMKNEGFAILDDEIRFGSYPMIKLDKDKFIIGDKEEADEFVAQILSIRKKWLFKAGRAEDNKSDEICFSYDGVNDTGGVPVQSRIADWIAQGLKQKETRIYMEAAVHMHSTVLDGSLALLNIPPVSNARLAGYRRQMLAIRKKELDQIVTRFSKGDKIKTGNDTFYPWKFEYVRDVAPEADATTT